MLAASYANFIVAGAAVDRSIILWKKGNLCLNSAFSADNSMHFAWCALWATTVATFSSAPCAAIWATTGLIHQTFLLVKLLFACCKNELISTITAFQGLVNETQTRDLLVI